MNKDTTQGARSVQLQELDDHEIHQVAGGKLVIVDGVQMEVSDLALSGLLNAASQITVKGVAYPGTQGVDW